MRSLLILDLPLQRARYAADFTSKGSIGMTQHATSRQGKIGTLGTL
jgi:hypothetical protein